MYKLLAHTGCCEYKVLAYETSLEEITAEVKKRVLNGCPLDTLVVVQEVDFELKIEVNYTDGSVAE